MSEWGDREVTPRRMLNKSFLIALATWADNSKLNPRGIQQELCYIIATTAIITPSAFGNALWILSKINVYSV